MPLNELLSDPDFQSLSLEGRKAAIQQVAPKLPGLGNFLNDPDWQGLSAEGQRTALLQYAHQASPERQQYLTLKGPPTRLMGFPPASPEAQVSQTVMPYAVGEALGPAVGAMADLAAPTLKYIPPIARGVVQGLKKAHLTGPALMGEGMGGFFGPKAAAVGGGVGTAIGAIPSIWQEIGSELEGMPGLTPKALPALGPSTWARPPMGAAGLTLSPGYEAPPVAGPRQSLWSRYGTGAQGQNVQEFSPIPQTQTPSGRKPGTGVPKAGPQPRPAAPEPPPGRSGVGSAPMGTTGTPGTGVPEYTSGTGTGTINVMPEPGVNEADDWADASKQWHRTTQSMNLEGYPEGKKTGSWLADRAREMGLPGGQSDLSAREIRNHTNFTVNNKRLPTLEESRRLLVNRK